MIALAYATHVLNIYHIQSCTRRLRSKRITKTDIDYDMMPYYLSYVVKKQKGYADFCHF